MYARNGNDTRRIPGQQKAGVNVEILFEMGQWSIFAEVTLGSLIEQWESWQCMVALAVCSSPCCPSTGMPSSSCSKAEGGGRELGTGCLPLSQSYSFLCKFSIPWAFPALHNCCQVNKLLKTPVWHRPWQPEALLAKPGHLRRPGICLSSETAQKSCKNFSFFPFFPVLLIQASQACYWSYSTISWNSGAQTTKYYELLFHYYVSSASLWITFFDTVLVKLRHKLKAADLRLMWSEQLWCRFMDRSVW